MDEFGAKPVDWRVRFLFACAMLAAEDKAEACYTYDTDERTGEPMLRVNFPDGSFAFSAARARAAADEAERVLTDTPAGLKQQAFADLAMGLRNAADQADEMTSPPPMP